MDSPKPAAKPTALLATFMLVALVNIPAPGLAAASSQSDSRTLACERSEALALSSAPPGVRRISADRLSVQWEKGTRVFENVGLEFRVGLDGTEYEYCGFALGHHLVKMREEGLFTGVLLDAANGNVLPAGHSVTFSPDAARYFAIRQPNGMYGEEWLVYSRAGTQLWQGESGIRAKSREGNRPHYIATLEQPRWSAAGELEATLRCTADTQKMATVTLRASGEGYVWEPRIECAP